MYQKYISKLYVVATEVVKVVTIKVEIGVLSSFSSNIATTSSSSSSSSSSKIWESSSNS